MAGKKPTSNKSSARPLPKVPAKTNATKSKKGPQSATASSRGLSPVAKKAAANFMKGKKGKKK